MESAFGETLVGTIMVLLVLLTPRRSLRPRAVRLHIDVLGGMRK